MSHALFLDRMQPAAQQTLYLLPGVGCVDGRKAGRHADVVSPQRAAIVEGNSWD
jgi:hypothetical protein